MTQTSQHNSATGPLPIAESRVLPKLHIIHWFRSPVGGIFRHVRDLVDQQVKEGHSVGIVCDDNTGGDFEQSYFDALEPSLELGLHRISMERSIGLKDLVVAYKLYKKIKPLDVDIFHSHGAKGGAYARLVGTALNGSGQKIARLYCPHGGSIHYSDTSYSGRLYFLLERALERVTDRLIFVCEYERDSYLKKVGTARCPHSVVYNGVSESEFEPIHSQNRPCDFGYIGMMRDLKGVDLFLHALPVAAERLGYPISAVLVGDGPDLDRYKEMSSSLGAQVTTTFQNPMNARSAFPLADVFVVPSRAESMPYIVLEALAAQRSLLATQVGGIPEIFGDHSHLLIKPDDLNALVDAMVAAKTSDQLTQATRPLAERVRERFSVSKMSTDVMRAYQDSISDTSITPAIRLTENQGS